MLCGETGIFGYIRQLMIPPLSELELQTEYRSGDDHLVNDFYIPCLERSTLYRRAVGYFTSSGLSVAAEGIDALIDNEGSMQLVASPLFEPRDLQAIKKGYESRDSIVENAILRGLDQVAEPKEIDRLSYLSMLISDGKLDIHVAVPIDKTGNLRQGIFHEKIGVFSDGEGHQIAFTGSPNETAGGLVDNFESIDVFWSWDDPGDSTRARRMPS